MLTWHTSPGSSLECQHRYGGRGRPEKLAGGCVGLHPGNGNQRSNPYWEKKNELTCSGGILVFDSHPDWTLLPCRNISLICNAPLLSLPRLNQCKEKLYRQMLIILRSVLHKVWSEKGARPPGDHMGLESTLQWLVVACGASSGAGLENLHKLSPQGKEEEVKSIANCLPFHNGVFFVNQIPKIQHALFPS